MPTLYKHTDPAWRCSCMTSARLFTCCCSRDRPSPTTRMRASSSSSLLLLLAAAAVGVLLQARPSECARAFFVFGDSLVDNGNNNYLMTTARADSPPYGIDYPTHRPTGRFSNGKNIPDIISEHLGAEPTLPYLSPELRGQKLLVGANFASAGVGILNDTGFQFVDIIRMSRQLHYFGEYQGKLSALVGAARARQLVRRSLVLITLGGNDFVNNYYLVPFSLRSRQFALPEYVGYIVSEYKKILIRLYAMGCRRVLVTGTGPLGCAPAILAQRSRNGECAAELMRAAALFNPQLARVLDQLNARFGAGTFIAANAFRVHFDFVSDPAAFGFATAKDACCGQGPHNGLGLCTPLSNLCADRSKYVFWDAYHPTERANRVIVSQFMSGSLDYVSPMNLSTVLQMDAAFD
ncbi:anther-specific proline-rich protein APG [Zea mays]|uniref:GDSL esterase/lipase LTL1 n=1 Tax=Zea mays TaxID=4577 RepID=B4FLN5_MAIZE|nr:anther-specific proline-rich protein APG [Zea mays]ACF83028.1 unknown [Zea mays]ONM06052.1 GDSL esterase/lipase LTL1 [Zea mays]|eukprot:NP_001136990.1 anther-specific proline-rich protein APG [Zea mays]